jgi:C-terminal processing protease CtpA/Prc
MKSVSRMPIRLRQAAEILFLRPPQVPKRRKKSKGFAVVAIVPGGPADKAGIRVQDVILKIDENDASFLSLAELVGKMNTSEYIVSIQRPEGTLNVTVHPMHYAEIAKLLQR